MENVSLFVDCLNFGAALKVVEYGQANPPVGYRWERFSVGRPKKSGARVRVTVMLRHIAANVEKLTPYELAGHKIAAALQTIADGPLHLRMEAAERDVYGNVCRLCNRPIENALHEVDRTADGPRCNECAAGRQFWQAGR